MFLAVSRQRWYTAQDSDRQITRAIGTSHGETSQCPQSRLASADDHETIVDVI